MLVKCRTNSGSALGPSATGLYYDAETIFEPLRVNEVYRVYGMALFQNAPLRNVDTPSDRYPPSAGLIILLCNLFSVEDSTLPSDWEFSSPLTFDHQSESKPRILARWGYRELHLDPHLDGLSARDPGALAAFRAEVDRREHEVGLGSAEA